VTFSPSVYAEDTDFERFVLDRLGTHRTRFAEPTAIHDVRGRVDGVGGNITVMVGAATTGLAARDELARSLRPLGFGAAYKVLDLLVEHVLEANRRGSGRFPFSVKSAALSAGSLTLPVPLDARSDVWDRLAGTYVALQNARHAVTHRRAQATASGDLEIHDDQGQMTDTVSDGEIAAFAAAVLATAELVIEGSSDERRLRLVAWHLNRLDGRHGLPSLAETDPDAYRRLLVMDLIEVDGGQLRFDAAQAKESVQGQQPSLWDLRLHAGHRVFVGHWEDVGHSDAPIYFDPGSPPAWLSEQVLEAPA
jgi:hypothetical protein